MVHKSAVGRSLPRLEGKEKVTGRIVYSADFARPGMLYGKILFSDRPHARIIHLDVSGAVALPGVEAVVTSVDTPNIQYGIYLKDKLIFARNRVRHVGEPVAAVAAVTQEIASEATKLIRVEYEDLPALFSPEEAVKPHAVLIHPELPSYHNMYPISYGNVCMEARLWQGDPDAGFAQACHIFEETYTTHAQHQAPLEPHACLADYDHNGRLTIWTGTQQLSDCHKEVADALELPMTEVRVIPLWIGGGFGGKLKSHMEQICAVLARASDKPVKLVLTREEEFTTTCPRPPYVMRLKTGVAEDGTILAKDVDILVDVGAYADYAIGTATTALAYSQGCYQVPNCRSRSRAVYTNNPNWGCMRGFGALQMNHANECHMDVIATSLGIDPVEYRQKNLAREGGERLTGQKFRGVTIGKTMDAALDVSNYAHRKGRLGPNKGIGMANCIINTGVLSSSAFVRTNMDGTVSVIAGLVDIGTGTYTGICQIAAETLGISVSRVRIASPDSDSAPYDAGSMASRTIYDLGSAVQLAAEDLRSQMLEVAAEQLNCKAYELVWESGCAFRKGDTEEQLTFDELVRISLYEHHGPPLGRGSRLAHRPFENLPGEGFVDYPVGAFLFGTHVVEVEVDPETGQVIILNYVAAHDVGRAINPLAVEGQVRGGVLQGIGYALYEEVIHENGEIKNPSFEGYIIPTALDAQCIKIVILEESDAGGPFGAKGIGEPPMLPPMPAIVNAVFDAVGVRMHEIPITSEKLFLAMRRKENEDHQRRKRSGPVD